MTSSFFSELVDWLVVCFSFNSPLRQYFSLYRTVSQGEDDDRRAEKKQSNLLLAQ